MYKENLLDKFILEQNELIEKYKKLIAESKRKCLNCEFYATFEGVCCNGDSDYRADFVDEDFSCKHFEQKI